MERSIACAAGSGVPRRRVFAKPAVGPALSGWVFAVAGLVAPMPWNDLTVIVSVPDKPAGSGFWPKHFNALTEHASCPK
jgi:hypothetical protein